MVERVRLGQVSAGIFAATAATACLDANPKFVEPPLPTGGGSGSATTGEPPIDTTDATPTMTMGSVSITDPLTTDSGSPVTTSPTTGPGTTDTQGVCGDGVVQGYEQCDHGADNGDNKSCTSLCQEAFCGDGLILDGAEACDDNNPEPNDGCVKCTVPATCKQILAIEPGLASGPYVIDPGGPAMMGKIPVYCDMELDGGGWTLVERSSKSDPIEVALFKDMPCNMGDPMNDRFRLPRGAMDAVVANATEMWLDCYGNDHLRTAASSLFAGEGGSPYCDNVGAVFYSEAVFRQFSQSDIDLCTQFHGINDGDCMGAFSIDEGAQYSGCFLPDYFWSGMQELVSPEGTDAFSLFPNVEDPQHDCHQDGAQRRIMLR